MEEHSLRDVDPGSRNACANVAEAKQMTSKRKNGAVVRANRLKVLRKDVHQAKLLARKQWREFDAILKEVEKLGLDVSKVSRHALVDVVGRFRKFRRTVATSTSHSRGA